MPTNLPNYRIQFGSFISETVAGEGDGTPGSAGQFELLDPQPTIGAELQAVFISQASNGEAGEARIDIKPLDGNYIEEPPENVGVQIFSIDRTGDSPVEALVFDGVVVKLVEAVDGRAYQASLVCYNRADDQLRRKKMYGQIWRNWQQEHDYFLAGPNLDPDTGEMTPVAVTFTEGDNIPTLFLPLDLPTVFNPQGKPNCAEQSYTISSDDIITYGDIWLFDAEDRDQSNLDPTAIQSIPWTLRRALCYIRTFCQLDWSIDLTTWSDEILQETFGDYNSDTDPVLFNINLQGRSLLECLQELTEPYGYGFTISPKLTDNGGHEIWFYSRTSTISCSDLSVDSGGTVPPNVTHYEITKDSTPVVNTGVFIGNYITHTTLATNDVFAGESVLPMSPGWNNSDLGYTMDDNDSTKVASWSVPMLRDYASEDLITFVSTDAGPKAVYGVGRIWLVNSGDAPDQVVEDLTDIFGENMSPINPRKLEQPNYYDKNSNSAPLTQRPITIEVSFNSGTSWDYVDPSKYKVLHDRPGIVFTDPYMTDFAFGFKNNTYAQGVDYWQALHDNTFRIRVICSFKSDTACKVFTYGDTDNTLVTEGVYTNLGFDRFVDHPEAHDSILYTNTAPDVPNVDDLEKLQDLADRSIASIRRGVYTGDVVVFCPPESASLYFDDFSPGFVVDGIYDRRDFSSNKPVIVRLTLDCISQFMTLQLTSRQGKAIIANHRDPLKEKYNQVNGAQRVNYYDDKTMNDYYDRGGK